VQASAANNKTRFHLPDGPEQVARDGEMSKSIIDFSLHSVAWLYGHDAFKLNEA
jgi:salicylate hydroxylase